VRALLNLVRANMAVVQNLAGVFRKLMKDSSLYLKILQPEVGDQELIKSVAAELAKLRALSRTV